MAYALSHLALNLRDRGQLDEAERSARETLRTRRGTLRPDDRDVTSSLMILGSILRRQGRVTEAEPLYLGDTHLTSPPA